MAVVNVEALSDGDGIKTLVFRADRDYLLDAASLHVSTQAFGELEISHVELRRSGLFLATHAWEFDNDVLKWTGWVILRRDEFVLGHLDYTAAQVMNMRLHLNPIKVGAGLSVSVV